MEQKGTTRHNRPPTGDPGNVGIFSSPASRILTVVGVPWEGPTVALSGALQIKNNSLLTFSHSTRNPDHTLVRHLLDFDQVNYPSPCYLWQTIPHKLAHSFLALRIYIIQHLRKN